MITNRDKMPERNIIKIIVGRWQELPASITTNILSIKIEIEFRSHKEMGDIFCHFL